MSNRAPRRPITVDELATAVYDLLDIRGLHPVSTGTSRLQARTACKFLLAAYQVETAEPEPDGHTEWLRTALGALTITTGELPR